ncbi:hypothetical protein U2T78_004343 [Providencia stuartii]|uniref:hypothetical protein n=1 Tax=Providencia stuartii TaxID=588 RepID=UPI001A34D616|nr:hypothetical protein [Providencia stuartii]EMA3643525.1 hypothetical protein [Providencia stuartii]MBW3103230.1 hypothetical protein [Providencia stuartii]MCB5219873.1 hypothetical protein [Providencia stuartii]MEB3135060.1 hypothetical protein [Providencia stuartii]HAU5776138.1 hypothetical protein [Providencia stuartii]
METIPTGTIGNIYSDGDELINQPNKEMLPAILSSAKAHQKHADHFLRVGAMHGNPALIIKGHLHDIVSRTLCDVLSLYDCNSIDLGELVEGTQDWLSESSGMYQFDEAVKKIIKFASLDDDV